MFVDLDRNWFNVCQNCTAEENDCPFVQKQYIQNTSSDPLADCQQFCADTPSCNAINYGIDVDGRIDCVLRACNDLPPATDPAPPMCELLR